MTPRWSPDRLASGAAIGAWAALFWWLLVTGRADLYLSSRTAWLIPVGAAITTIAAAARLATARAERPRPVTAPWALGVIVLPVVLAFAAPPSTLSSYAVERRSSFSSVRVAATARDVAGPLDIVDVAAARSSDEALALLRRRSGEPIVLEGFVTSRPDLGADEVLLTRFVVTCCVADATIAQVRVVEVPPGAFSTDDWIRVRGRVYALGAEILVVAERVEEIPPPEVPYLTP